MTYAFLYVYLIRVLYLFLRRHVMLADFERDTRDLELPEDVPRRPIAIIAVTIDIVAWPLIEAFNVLMAWKIFVYDQSRYLIFWRWKWQARHEYQMKDGKALILGPLILIKFNRPAP